TISYRSIDKAWSQWGWSVVNQRVTPQIFTVLSTANAAGFSFKGRDPAIVTTATLYVPGSVHVVRVKNPRGTIVVSAVAGATGRIQVVVSPRTLLGSVGTSVVTVS